MTGLERRALLGDRQAQERKLKRVWRGMIERCSNPKHISYKNYGAKGISVCELWLEDFSEFEKWAFENGYSNGLTIDRIDVNGNYCPENCRWASYKEQNRNKRNSVYIETPIGKMTVAEYCEKTGANPFVIYSRIRRGMPESEACRLDKIKHAKRGEDSPAAKLNWEKVREIRLLSREGKSSCRIAKLYGVSKKSILNIIHNKTWIENDDFFSAFEPRQPDAT